MLLPDLRPRHPLAGLAICATLGIAAADRWVLPGPWLLAVVAGIAVGCLVWPRTLLCWLLTGAFFAALHSARIRTAAAPRLAAELAGHAVVGEVTGVVWSEPRAATGWSGDPSGFFDVKVESLSARGATARDGLLLGVAWCGPLPSYGDRVAMRGRLANLEPVRNPGAFDFRQYRQRRGVFSELQIRFPGDGRIESAGHGVWPVAFASRARRWIQETLRRDLADAPEVAGLIESMVLGLQGETPDETRAMFEKTGTLHLFAVSGLNIAMLAAIALHGLKPFGIRRRAAVLLVIPLLAGYALVTGLSSSCVRAAIMGAAVLAAQLFDRPVVVCNSLAAAALGILAWDTQQLFLPGFQFSFTLVLVIVLLAIRIQKRCERLAQPDPFLPRSLWSAPVRSGVWCWRHFSAAVGVTLAAWLGSLAFTAGYFHLFSFSGLFANLFAVPLAFVVLLLGLGTIFCAGFWTYGALLCSQANWLAAKMLLAVVGAFAGMPGGHRYVELPRRGPPVTCEVTVLDCGEGAAMHLRAGGDDWLIDCGNARAVERTVIPYLRSRGVNRLDGLILTHGDAQHLGGAPALIADFGPRAIYETPLRDRSPTRRGLHRALRERGIGKAIVWRGDRLVCGGRATLQVLHPSPGGRGVAADDQALVALLESAGVRVLFLSDAGVSTEQWLLEHEPGLRSDLVVKGWHSKDLSGTADFLRRLGAQAVISSAPEFGTGPEALDGWESALRARGIRVFRQEKCGAVQLAMEAGEFTLRTVADGQTFTSRAR